MERIDFERAASEGLPVRLKDRTRCNYHNEWYVANVTETGELRIQGHTGETHTVDDGLLDALRTPERHARVNELMEALARMSQTAVPVVELDDGTYLEIRPDQLQTGEVLLEAGGEEDNRPWRHAAGPAPGLEPTASVIVLAKT